MDINTASEIAIIVIIYKSNPIAMPIETENHIDVAVVKLVILSSPSL